MNTSSKSKSGIGSPKWETICVLCMNSWSILSYYETIIYVFKYKFCFPWIFVLLFPYCCFRLRYIKFNVSTYQYIALHNEMVY